MEVSIVIPAYNEEKNIERLLRDVYSVFRKNKYSGNIVVVNDCSTDGTLKICTRLKKEIKNLKIITHKKRSGKTAAILNGLKTVKTKYMVMIDADYQYDPRDIPKVVKKLDGHKLVSGWRTKRNDSFGRLFFSYFFNLIVRKLFGIKIHDINCGLKGYSAKLLRNIKFAFSGFFIDTELLARAYKNGINVAEVKIKHYARRDDKSKVNCIKLGIDTLIKAIELKFILHREFLIQFLKFCIVGASGTLISLAVLYSLTEFLGFHYLISAIFAFVISLTTNFILNKFWTFEDRSKSKTLMKYGKFFVVNVAALVVNLFFLYIFVEYFGIWYVLAQFLAICIAMIVNFIGSKFWAFKK